MGTAPELLPDEVQEAIAADYLAGKKLRTIEQTYDITRSTVYWVLQRKGVAPQRTKPKSRLNLDADDPQLLRKLYDVIDAQDQRIRELEAVVCEASSVVMALTEVVAERLSEEEAMAFRKNYLDKVEAFDITTAALLHND